MYVCVQCVFIVTTKCKAMMHNHHDEQDDQETSSLFFIFLYYILCCSGPASIRETDDEKNIYIW